MATVAYASMIKAANLIVVIDGLVHTLFYDLEGSFCGGLS